jgi:tripartite-type tricarboxylate transporter receptor subunit TctC
LRNILRAIAIASTGAALLSTAAGASAQSYPAKPVRFVVGYAPGGIGDSTARIVAQHVTARIGQNVLVESRLGAGGRIASEYISKSAPDGYALNYTANGTHSFAAVTEKNLPYHPVRDFTPVALIGTFGFLMVVHPSLPVKSVNELIVLAKKNPRKLNYSTSGTGSGIHFAGELFNIMGKVEIVHVPYKGAVLALNDVIGGNVEITFDAGAGAAVEAGQVRLLGTTSTRRDPRFPNVPTLSEAGLKGFDVISWNALFGPPKLPAAITAQLNGAVNEALRDPKVVERLKVWGMVPTPGAPEQLDSLLKSEIARYGKIATDGKMTFQ